MWWLQFSLQVLPGAAELLLLLHVRRPERCSGHHPRAPKDPWPAPPLSALTVSRSEQPAARLPFSLAVLPCRVDHFLANVHPYLSLQSLRHQRHCAHACAATDLQQNVNAWLHLRQRATAEFTSGVVEEDWQASTMASNMGCERTSTSSSPSNH